MPLWHCHEPPQAYSDAYKAVRDALISAGYSWTGLGHGHAHLVACWWDMSVAVDVAALQAGIDRAIAEAAARRVEQARAAEERIAAEVAEVVLSAPPIREQLAEMLRDRPWAVGRHLGEASALVAMGRWTRHGLHAADRYLSNARGNVERAGTRLGRVPPATWYARAGDPDIRAAALSACRILSTLDTDWAAVRNSAGWSQATCWTGHVLSERDILDQGEAAHALALLHGHRLQLPDELNLLLFGAAPTRWRRSAPSDAPSLPL